MNTANRSIRKPTRTGKVSRRNLVREALLVLFGMYELWPYYGLIPCLRKTGPKALATPSPVRGANANDRQGLMVYAYNTHTSWLLCRAPDQI